MISINTNIRTSELFYSALHCHRLNSMKVTLGMQELDTTHEIVLNLEYTNREVTSPSLI